MNSLLNGVLAEWTRLIVRIRCAILGHHWRRWNRWPTEGGSVIKARSCDRCMKRETDPPGPDLMYCTSHDGRYFVRRQEP